MASASSGDIYGLQQVIERCFDALQQELAVVNTSVEQVKGDLQGVQADLGTLAQNFHDYVQAQGRANVKSSANQQLIQLHQLLKQRFGQYDEVRRLATGILQADDVGIVTKEAITSATEDIMLSAPGYWLAPCLVALAAWIADRPGLANKALQEGIRRSDEKTSLFFALVCRRAGRPAAALKWTQRYLATQEEESVDRKTMVVLKAFVNGLLGVDSEGVVERQISHWLKTLLGKPGFVEEQTKQWSEAFTLKKPQYAGTDYPYLQQYSETWPVLADVMGGAELHGKVLAYFDGVFQQEEGNESLSDQLDAILFSLVTDYDDEELPLRRKEKYNQLLVDFEGDSEEAKRHMALEEIAFASHKDFTQLLTDAALHPEISHAGPAVQKFAIALSREWIGNAYNDVVGQNRLKIPNEILIKVDSFQDKTADGRDEEEILGRFNKVVAQEKAAALAQCVVKPSTRFWLLLWLLLAVVAAANAVAESSILWGIGATLGFCFAFQCYGTTRRVAAARKELVAQFGQKLDSGTQILRALLAEVVDIREEFAVKDQESHKVSAFLQQLSPEQYVKRSATSRRRINVSS